MGATRQTIQNYKQLGIDTVMCDVHTYNNEDEILQDLLETNIRQRGDIGGSAKKVGFRIKELERIYGIRESSAGNSELNNSTGDTPKTESEFAEQLGVSRYTLQNYKQLAEKFGSHSVRS